MSVLGQVCRVVRHNSSSPPSEGPFPPFPGESALISKVVLKGTNDNVLRVDISHSSTGTPIDSCGFQVMICL
jgi:hypothetical protein